MEDSYPWTKCVLSVCTEYWCSSWGLLWSEHRDLYRPHDGPSVDIDTVVCVVVPTSGKAMQCFVRLYSIKLYQKCCLPKKLPYGDKLWNFGACQSFGKSIFTQIEYLQNYNNDLSQILAIHDKYGCNSPRTKKNKISLISQFVSFHDHWRFFLNFAKPSCLTTTAYYMIWTTLITCS